MKSKTVKSFAKGVFAPSAVLEFLWLSMRIATLAANADILNLKRNEGPVG